ncbi:MAG: Ig domain-containing protein [Prevotella sp.]|jgi:uncharacterized protein (TIGR02145 family)|nr:Ig domain-containing protein [Prevotella sp.]
MNKIFYVFRLLLLVGVATLYFTSCSNEEKEDQYIEVISVELDRATLNLEPGQQQTLAATVKPDNATDKTVTWTSSNTTVATVDNYGTITAVASGTAIITAKAGNTVATCTITVARAVIAVASIELNKTTLTLTAGDSETLTATVAPSNATDKTVTWTSSNTSVATVDVNGKVTAIAKGTATIVAQTSNNKTANCTITVNDASIPLYDDLIYTKPVSFLDLIPGEEYSLYAKTNPTGQPVTWTSSNSNIVAVSGDYSEGKITGKTPGTVTIRATSPGQTATCTITVYDQPISGITINGVTWATRNVDAPGTFTANVSDVGMLYQWNRKTGWSSTNPPVSSPTGQTWDSSVPTGSTWTADNDPCPSGWRVPSYDDYMALRNTYPGNGSLFATASKRIVNGKNMYRIGTGGSALYTPTLLSRFAFISENGSYGVYDNLTQYSLSTVCDADARYALTFDLLPQLQASPFCKMVPVARSRAINIRCVKK